ncbi:MAG: Stp1/IreP family PP2C-type Ser/Thr phosphatase [Myxococcota bacterium]
MQLTYAGATNVGMKRAHNEDAYFLMAEENLYLVADGMGGHSSGEIASQLAIETIANFFRATSNDDEVTWPFKMEANRGYDENRLLTSIKLANLRIFESAQRDPRYKGMGTTVVSTLFSRDGLIISHVGDSRAYLLRNSALELLTTDHSLLNDYIKAKNPTEEEIKNFPHKNVIVRALGMKEVVEVDIIKKDFNPGDIFLLCSDGLSGMVPDDKLKEIIDKNSNLDRAVEELIDAANRNGGTDNITVVLVRVEKE